MIAETAPVPSYLGRAALERAEATARVMAASRELLEALEALLFTAKAELADPEDCACIRGADAAIKKARGEA